MATYSPIESPSPRPTARSPFAPVFLWLVIQLIALAIPIARVPFFATKHFPHTPETLASGVMLVFQIGSSALLFPFLLRDVKTATMAVAASWPFTVLAGFLTAQPDQRTLPAAALYVSVWLIGLALWRSVLTTPRRQGIGIAVAALVALDGPLLWYFHAEYSLQSGGPWRLVGSWGPILGAITLTEGDPMLTRAWFFAGGHFFLALFVCILHRLAVKRP